MAKKFPDKYEIAAAEPRIREFWEKKGIFRFDAESKKELFSLDTPPPTVSGKMHMGHALAYSQADFIMRFRRMAGCNVFYPFGFDDNGLATERFVEKKLGIRSNKMPRPEFIKLCLKETEEAEKELKKNWQALGISCDWEWNYRTIDEHCRKISQYSLIDLYKKGRVYRKKSPMMICPSCQTAIAQVELKDKEQQGKLYHIQVEVNNGEKITFATTRPELYAACVGISVHPNDKRYKHLIGKKVNMPITGKEVKIIPDKEVKMEFGTGVVYMCSYGGIEDIEWLVRHKEIEPIDIMGLDGKLNEKAGKLAGMKSPEARKAMAEELKKAGFLVNEETIKNVVNTHERCETPIEFVATEQWFIRYLDLKDKFLEVGAELNWHPKHMKHRYDNWIKGLKWDWCISRQRFFGVPFPLWYCKKCKEVILAEEKELPVDPITDKPSKSCKCGSNEFEGEKDVLDTWATSSLTPQIALKWRTDNKFFEKMFPMSLRSNGHDIITFWLFNTVVKAVLHEDKLPWKDVMINGFVLDPHRQKMAKSKGNIIEPMSMIEKYGSDALRFWAAGTKLGDDMPFQEKDLVTGKRCITKLWNATKFSLMQLENYKPLKRPKLERIDAWLLSKLNRIVKEAKNAFMEYEFYKPKTDTENFFWHVFCDNYLEIVEDRIYNKDKYTSSAIESAKFTLYNALFKILRMTAPIMPHVTEEIYQNYFMEFEKEKSIHNCSWPEFEKELEDKEAELVGDEAVRILGMVRQHKAQNKVSLKIPLKLLRIESKLGKLKELEDEIKSAAVAERLEFGEVEKPNYEEGELKIKIEM